MKKITIWLVPVCIITIILTMLSCQKELPLGPTLTSETQTLAKHQVTRAVRDTFAGVMMFIPDFASGGSWTDFALAWFPAEADGNFTILPSPSIDQANTSTNAHTYQNTYTIRNAQGKVITYGRSVKQFYAKELEKLNLQIPDEVHVVTIDEKGNTLWGQLPPEGWPSWWVDPTHIAMDGKSFIVGGTGKYAGAKGENKIHAQFNIVPFEGNKIHFSYSEQGTITY
jgi:hypothetical protein